MKQNKLKITKDTLISDLLEAYPFLDEILVKDYDLHCAICFINKFDTIEQGAKVHGMSDSEVEEMIKHLNLEVEKRKSNAEEAQNSKVKTAAQNL